MTAAPTPVAVLLVELARHGIELRAVGDRLRYRPRSAMTPDLADQLTVHRTDLLAILDVADGAVATYTGDERRLLAGCTAATRATVETTKRAFSVLGGVKVESIRPFKSESRDGAARVIREARCAGKQEHAFSLRDAWHERLAICTVDGDLSVRDAERLALDELKGARP